jgi:hypothetical protein
MKRAALLLLAACASAPATLPCDPEPRYFSTMLEAEIETVTRYASRLPGPCSHLELERYGGGGIQFHTLPPTLEMGWGIVACERVIDLTLDCSDQPGAYRCGTHEEWYPDRSDDSDFKQRFFAAALREAKVMPGSGTCAEVITVRSVGGYRRSGEVDLETCGATKRVKLTCEGQPLTCRTR